ncbi:hypothetical protein DFJ73DRAFT_892518 [Zopfochytrium polystomum]|nr:hypothetical protein DFJ73DRAFT_892518 [Zopfochytrium polystomum]
MKGIPFKDGPPVAQDFCMMLNRAVPSARFNELLLLAYIDGNKMNYHADDEEGLTGPVATWSFGFPATMSFRVSKRPRPDAPPYHGQDPTRQVTRDVFLRLSALMTGEDFDTPPQTPPQPPQPAPPLSTEPHRFASGVSGMPSDGRTAQSDLELEAALTMLCLRRDNKRSSSQIPQTRRTRPLLQEIVPAGPADNSPAQSEMTEAAEVVERRHAVIFKLALAHGDLIVMDGESIQHFYEHSIDFKKGVRFVVTARRIGSDAAPDFLDQSRAAAAPTAARMVDPGDAFVDSACGSDCDPLPHDETSQSLPTTEDVPMCEDSATEPAVGGDENDLEPQSSTPPPCEEGAPTGVDVPTKTGVFEGAVVDVGQRATSPTPDKGRVYSIHPFSDVPTFLDANDPAVTRGDNRAPNPADLEDAAQKQKNPKSRARPKTRGDAAVVAFGRSARPPRMATQEPIRQTTAVVATPLTSAPAAKKSARNKPEGGARRPRGGPARQPPQPANLATSLIAEATTDTSTAARQVVVSSDEGRTGTADPQSQQAALPPPTRTPSVLSPPPTPQPQPSSKMLKRLRDGELTAHLQAVEEKRSRTGESRDAVPKVPPAARTTWRRATGPGEAAVREKKRDGRRAKRFKRNAEDGVWTDASKDDDYDDDSDNSNSSDSDNSSEDGSTLHTAASVAHPSPPPTPAVTPRPQIAAPDRQTSPPPLPPLPPSPPPASPRLQHDEPDSPASSPPPSPQTPAGAVLCSQHVEPDTQAFTTPPSRLAPATSPPSPPSPSPRDRIVPPPPPSDLTPDSAPSRGASRRKTVLLPRVPLSLCRRSERIAAISAKRALFAPYCEREDEDFALSAALLKEVGQLRRGQDG